jgi:hypothetical protein
MKDAIKIKYNGLKYRYPECHQPLISVGPVAWVVCREIELRSPSSVLAHGARIKENGKWEIMNESPIYVRMLDRVPGNVL